MGRERLWPNLVLGGVDAYGEYRVDMLHIDTGAGGNVRLHPDKPCVRSPIPDINPANADHVTQLRDALRRYRQDARMGDAITIGMSANVRAGAGQVLRVGQQLGANYRFE